MSFSINLVERPNKEDNLLILATTNYLDPIFPYLNENERAYLEHAAVSGIHYVFFPKSTNSILVHFIDTSDDLHYQKELVRIAGNVITSAFTHYKIRDILLVNTLKNIGVAEYVEGMVLGGYEFTKYFSHSNGNQKIPHQINIASQDLSIEDLNGLQAVLEATFKARDLVNEPQS